MDKLGVTIQHVSPWKINQTWATGGSVALTERGNTRKCPGPHWIRRCRISGSDRIISRLYRGDRVTPVQGLYWRALFYRAARWQMFEIDKFVQMAICRDSFNRYISELAGIFLVWYGMKVIIFYNNYTYKYIGMNMNVYLLNCISLGFSLNSFSTFYQTKI